ncbi:putative membrane protein [Bosea sp. BE125]|uniref:hypothetical protein n=1 Tax=Bosea sp. BE125 TaxID=2817909 RepID=UPI002855C5A6|nr:hypothetical protein [Bosea sp. BE125]MDR6873544.1 putative membrane protein [Bosea sp. BE125]
MHMEILPHDHPRVIASSPAMTPGERRAMWPRGVRADVVAVSERKMGVKPPAPASKPAPKPAATTVAAKPTPAPPAQAPAPAAKAAAQTPTRQQQLDRAMENAIRAFNQRNQL